MPLVFPQDDFSTNHSGMRAELIGARGFAKALNNLGKEIPESVKEDALFETGINAVSILQKPGLSPTYPIDWASARQRAAFYASDGFGRGIPTRRTDEAVNAWNAIKVIDGAEVMKPLSHAGHIFGDAFGRYQSPIHKNRWNPFADVIRAVLNLLPQKVVDSVRLAVGKVTRG